jgi:hypothetical protein
MYLQKVISRRLFKKISCFSILNVNDEKIAGSGSASGPISQRHGSAVPDLEFGSKKMSWISNTARNYITWRKDGGG